MPVPYKAIDEFIKTTNRLSSSLPCKSNVAILHASGYIVTGDTTYKVITDHLGKVGIILNARTGE